MRLKIHKKLQFVVCSFICQVASARRQRSDLCSLESSCRLSLLV